MLIGPSTINSHPITLRAATTADQPIIKQMVRGAHLNPMGLNWQRFILAVTPDDETVGCIQLKPHRGEVNELASLVVNRKWRRTGVARFLINHLKDTAGAPLWLMCASNLVRFYEPFGFHRVYLGQPMPGYFRRILRLATIFNRMGSQNYSLAIMVWN